MVVFPKSLRTNCPCCRKHQKHKVTIYKKNKERPNPQGARRYRIKKRGFGGQPKPVFKKNAKNSKKIVVKLQCANCKKIHQRVIKRCKSFKLENKKKN